MLKKKTTILFDVDGTLFDSIPTILESFQGMFTKLEENYPGDKIIKTFLGSDLDNTLKDFIPQEKIRLAKDTYREIYFAKQDLEVVPLFDDAIEILEYLKKENYTLGIVTTKMRKYATPLFDTVKIRHFFDIIIGSEDVENRKPHPEPLLKAVKDLNITLEDSVYVGDALIDMEASNRANMDFIAVTTGTTSKKAFQKAEQKIIVSDLINLKKLL